MTLLAPDERTVAIALNPGAASPFLLLGDHAGREIPRALGTLGLPADERRRHIAWDIGVAGLGQALSAALGATFIRQRFSRLVIDCNRDPSVGSSIPKSSEWTDIPGNLGLSEEDLLARRTAIFDPYHEHLRTLIDQRIAAGRSVVLVAQHSMTNSFKGVQREMHAAVLYNRDRRFASLVLEMLRREAQLTIAENEPYFVSDQSDFTIPRHAEARGLPYVAIEIRQDLITSEAGQAEWAVRITNALRDAGRRSPGAVA
jgi:predicted N-formylglutamate amidohydrolase